jgi:CubicO group peptidase (beta-lactamase class C family)
MRGKSIFRFLLGCTFLILVFSLIVSLAWAEMPLPLTKPESIGLSPERLNRISALLKEDTEKGKLVGAVALIVRKGKIGYLETFGYQDKLAGKKMQVDTIFRLYSMSKPITSVALLMLFEEGKIDLGDPLDMYLPEFKDPKVAIIGKGADGKPAIVGTEPANRKITIQDIFRHTAGLTYGFPTGHPLDALYISKGTASYDQTLAELSDKLGSMPLMFQPGTMWHYSFSHDIQARLVEVVSGMPFDKFLEARIFKPLGMKDTGFYVKKEDHPRLARFEPVKDEKTGNLIPNPADLAFMAPQKMLSGGGGLVSTASDYLRFAQMLLNGGKFNGQQFLSPKTIAYMASDHLGTIPQNNLYESVGPGWGYGLGVGVRIKQGEALYNGSVGNYYWGGAAGTVFWNDPQEEMISMILFQDFNLRMHYRRIYGNLAYQALVN